MGRSYDAIVVGARCAGAPTAMLLARKGYRVLAVDRATFPSDTISTHLVHPPGIASLRRWGLLDRFTATGCPPIDTYSYDFGPFTLAGAPGTVEAPVAYCPRRTVLDQLLVDAAAEAGVEVREAFTVEDVLREDGRVAGIRGHGKGAASVAETAQVVVGADGRHSRVATAVRPEEYRRKPPLLAAYYAYWSGLPMGGRFETYSRTKRGFAAAPTHDDLTMVIGGWPVAELEANRTDIEGNWLAMLDLAPDFADRVRGATRETRFVGTSVENYVRKPYGAGWALVGDAGYNKDFITGQGIHDAFRDAELLATALDRTFTGDSAFDDAMAGYQAARDSQVLPMYELTLEIASLEPPPPDLQAILAAAYGNQEAMDAFVRMNAGVLSPAEFFSEQNVRHILAGAEGPDGGG